MFIRTVDRAEADGVLGDIYQTLLDKLGYIPDHQSVFSLRSDVLEAWRAFQGTIRKHIRLRRYELATLAAARALSCRYCLLAHGQVLLDNGVSLDELRAILTDFHDAGLDPQEVAVMDFAEKIALRAHEMTQADVDTLRGEGLDDSEVLDVTLTATMRCFASKTFNALGAGPDAVYSELERQLEDLLPA